MSNRVEQMDMLRGLAIVGVVAIHTAAETLTARVTFLGILVNQLVRFAVPAFIFLSGLGRSLKRSAAVSPTVVAMTLMSQKKMVTSGTLFNILRPGERSDVFLAIYRAPLHA